jgi:hypothetical protein
MDVRVVTLRDSVNKNKKVIEVIKPRNPVFLFGIDFRIEY